MTGIVSDLDSALAPEGPIARRLPSFECRPQQREMAVAVARAFAARQHLLVEAGTGVGKSFAYLVPAVERIVRHGERVVISTHTIALQEQLIHKDIPLLQSALCADFDAVLVKGRSNYLGLRRLRETSKRQKTLFDRTAQLSELWRLEEWAYETIDGSLSDLDPQPHPAVWERIRSEAGNCMGRRCDSYRKCFYQQARRRAEEAKLLVVNHALFFADLALRRQGASILPDYDLAVLDEAHTVESVAADHFGSSISDSQVRYLLNALSNEKGTRGLLRALGDKSSRQAVHRTRELGQRFFDQLATWQQNDGRRNGRLTRPPPVTNTLSPALRDLQRTVQEIAESVENQSARFEISAHADRAGAYADMLQCLLGQSELDWVYWIEAQAQRQRRITLHGRPIEVAGTLREALFASGPVVLTSATMTTGAVDPFAYIRRRLGVDDGRAARLGSPFDFASAVTLYLETGMPDPGDGERFFPAACAAIRHYLKLSDGRAFVLFTGYDLMFRCADALESFCATENMPLLVQGRGTPRSAMLERFRADIRSVIFGTDSFWGGVDVPGETLSNVIIVKLPFAVPDHPPIEARLERIRRAGGNPFMQYQLPEAVLRFKQGFGRLVRTKDDRGMVVVLDPRIRRKPYGRAFLDALPQCSVVEHQRARVAG